MRNPLRRIYDRGHLHLRRSVVIGGGHFSEASEHETVWVKTLDEVRSRHKFRVTGYVVMPEHVHLLVSEPSSRTPSTVLQVFKQKISRAFRREPKRMQSKVQEKRGQVKTRTL